MSKWILVVFCLLLFIRDCYPLKCYQCNFCGDPFKASQANIVNCSGSCEKTKETIDVVRLCSPGYIEDDCGTRHTHRGMTKRYKCACNQDLCNGASSVCPYITVLLALLICFGFYT